jgi:N-dimethylarginine dimethylaminohydrolase
MNIMDGAAALDAFSLQRREPNGGTARLNYWGSPNEYAVLTDVSLCRPDYLRHMATSSLSRKYLRESPSNLPVAKQQFEELASAYEHFGVRIHWMDPDPALPMQVYTRDSSFMTPYGAVITNMFHWWRRGENFQAIRHYEKIGVPIYDMVTAGVFEGGDFAVIEEGCVLIGCGGERTQEEAALQVGSWFDREGWETKVTFFDPFYVHIDLMVVMIADKLAAVCLATTAPDVVSWLRAKKIDIIDVPFEDTMTLGCNVVTVGRDRVIAPAHSRILIDALKARGFEVAAVAMDEISKTGGGIHCMAQELRRVPA